MTDFNKNVEDGFDCLDDLKDSIARIHSLEKVLFNPTFKDDAGYGDVESVFKSSMGDRIRMLTNEENFERYARFIKGEKVDECWDGYKLWWTRDGFPTINTLSIRDGLGKYNNQKQFDTWLWMFTHTDEWADDKVKMRSEEVVAWYAKYKDRINTLYDLLTQQGLRSDLIDEFNMLCEDGWRLFMYEVGERQPSHKPELIIPFGHRNAYIGEAKKWSAKLR